MPESASSKLNAQRSELKAQNLTRTGLGPSVILEEMIRRASGRPFVVRPAAAQAHAATQCQIRNPWPRSPQLPEP